MKAGAYPMSKSESSLRHGLQIIWSPEAVADLTNIREFVARDSENYAAALMHRIITSIDRLQEFPNLGYRVLEIDDDSIRQLVVGHYRVIYRVAIDSVELAAVVHTARDLAAFLE